MYHFEKKKEISLCYFNFIIDCFLFSFSLTFTEVVCFYCHFYCCYFNHFVRTKTAKISPHHSNV